MPKHSSISKPFERLIVPLNNAIPDLQPADRAGKAHSNADGSQPACYILRDLKDRKNLVQTPENCDMNAPLLTATDLRRRYGNIEAVDGVSLSVNRGEVLGLLGLNGAGKSSTLKMLAGVAAPDVGHISIDGHSMDKDPLMAKSKLGFLPEIAPLYPDMKVIDYLRFAAKLRRVRRKLIKSRVNDLIDELKLESHAHRTIANLSKGYKQRVGIAQALIHHPPLVILDEPGSGLDPEQMREMRLLIRALGRSRGVIFSSHLLPEITETCHRVVVLHKGQKRYEGGIPGADIPSRSNDDPLDFSVNTQALAGGMPTIDIVDTADFTVKFSAGTNFNDITSGLDNINVVEHFEPDLGERWIIRASVLPETLLQALVTCGLPVTEFKLKEQTLETLFSQLVNSNERVEDIPTLHNKIVPSDVASKTAATELKEVVPS